MIMPAPTNQNTDHFSECVERHAYSTYDKFLKLHGGKTALMSLLYKSSGCCGTWTDGLIFCSCDSVSQ
jgi:hypothetical protein